VSLTLLEISDSHLFSTYIYDGNGNTSVINAVGSLNTNTWDIENHITRVDLPGAVVNTMTYDGDGKRRAFGDSVMVRNFIWDGENIARQTGSDGTTDRRYTLNPQRYGELISQDGPVFHHYDVLGSTMQLTDASQNVVDTYLYKAFGDPTHLTGTSPNRFGWLGKLGYYHQPDSSDYWVRARVYRPTIGRWVSRDPMRDEINWYAYAGNEPLTNVDPDGRCLTGSISLTGCTFNRGTGSHHANCSKNLDNYAAHIPQIGLNTCYGKKIKNCKPTHQKVEINIEIKGAMCYYACLFSGTKCDECGGK
jgi:RHS repeat-associated protein